MSPKFSLVFTVFIFVVFLLLTAGCTDKEGGLMPAAAPDKISEVDSLFIKAEAAMDDAGYSTAERLYKEAYYLYKESGDTDGAISARNGMFRAVRAVAEYPYNRSLAEAEMRAKIPSLTDAGMAKWLDEGAQTIKSDGETLYFESVAANYLYAHTEELRPMADAMMDFEYTSRYAIPKEGTASAETENIPYINPVRYSGTEKLVVPDSALPDTGTLYIWYPLPLETESQRDVIVTNLSYSDNIVRGPVTDGRIAYVYYEIPVEDVTGDLLVTADIAYTSYEQRFEVYPSDVGAYNKTDPEYILYTSSSRNIEVSDEIKELAEEITGNEKNPYLQAQAIYWYIIENYPYSLVPHASLDTIEPKVAESAYMLATGHGDCGTQSQFFSALCRSIGIPARATGGYQILLSEKPGTHFWAEYYIEGYGWIPCDKTVAEIADWVDIPEEKRELFKTYYADSLDPARLVIQEDVDVLMDPPFPDDAVVFRLVRQSPAIVCDEAGVDFEMSGPDFTIDLKKKE